MDAKKIKGKIIIVSSPSGGGKSSICRTLLEKYDDWKFSVSYTTRKMRPNEKNGREYYFVDHDIFRKMCDQDQFAEYFEVHNNMYGTPRGPMEDVLFSGGVMLLDVDVQGAKKLKELYPLAATIFILPPSKEVLEERLKKRFTETEEEMKTRLANAVEEMKLFSRFEYTVVNDNLETAINEVEMIINSLHCRKLNLNLEQINRIVG